MSKLRRKNDAAFCKNAIEKNSGVSDTAPNQALPIQEILRKAQQGVPVHLSRPVYDPVKDILADREVDPLNRVGFSRIDLAERECDLQEELQLLNSKNGKKGVSGKSPDSGTHQPSGAAPEPAAPQPSDK